MAPGQRCTGIRHGVARGKIVRTIRYHIIGGDKRGRVLLIETKHMLFDLCVRIDALQCIHSAIHLPAADRICVVDELPLEVRERYTIVVDDADRPDAGCRKIGEERRTEPAGADD